MRSTRYGSVLFAWLAFAGVTSAVAEERGAKLFGTLQPMAVALSSPERDRLRYLLIAREEAHRMKMPLAIVDAVMKIESNYVPSRIGTVGEIGLMQVRPGTAALLGFRGRPDDLAKPDVNIHYGTAYLGEAWRLANGDVCRTLMKYRAGHGEEVMSALSSLYCARARAHLVAVNSPLAKTMAGLVLPDVPAASLPSSESKASDSNLSKQRHPYHGPGFWAWQQARIKAITARLHARWNRVAAN